MLNPFILENDKEIYYLTEFIEEFNLEISKACSDIYEPEEEKDPAVILDVISTLAEHYNVNVINDLYGDDESILKLV